MTNGIMQQVYQSQDTFYTVVLKMPPLFTGLLFLQMLTNFYNI